MGWNRKGQKRPLKTGIEKTEKVELVTFDGRQFKCDPASPEYEYLSNTYKRKKQNPQNKQKKQNKKNKQGNQGKLGRSHKQNLGRRSGVSQWHPSKDDPKDWWRRR